MNIPSLLTYADSELVIALTYPLGTDRDLVLSALKNHLAKFGYTTREIRVSSLFARLENLRNELEDSPEHRRIETRMDAGNKARARANRQDFVGLAAVSEVSKTRSGAEDPQPLPRTAVVIDSLKRPEEVAVLRRIYGPGFFLVGVFASEATRRRYLTEDKNIPGDDADRLMKRDLDEANPNGQRTRETFHLADVFISLDDQTTNASHKDQLWRFLDLVFGHPHHTPTRDEHAMYLAYAASFRSGDLSRQVGAALTTPQGDLLALGCNDVPGPGGGLYWPGEDDQRDSVRGADSNHERREEIIDEVIDILDIETENRAEAKSKLALSSPLKDITEYGRAVHAEMEALLAAARTGRSPVTGTLYVTTFPCHNCTRHIVAAGLRRVVYVEPYPKSRASELHGDSIYLRDQDGGEQGKRVCFEPFVGVGPRRYVDMFSLRLGGGAPKLRKEGAKSLQWVASESRHVRVPMSPNSYLDRERLVVHEIDGILSNLGGSEFDTTNER